MTARIIGGVTVDLDDGPIRTSYGRSLFNGLPTAHLQVGPDLAICITSSSPETLRQLEEAVAELRAWTERQAAKQVA